MAKVADIEFTWTPSATPEVEIEKVKVTISRNGSKSDVEFGPAVRSYTATFDPFTNVTVEIEVTDKEGLKATESHSFLVGDLELPQPVTDIQHRIVAIREV